MKALKDNQWDAFISHASEDKRVVRLLVDELTKIGLFVWHDDDVIVPGRSIRQAIEHGLARSMFGIALLSQSYLRKTWALQELNGLFQLETARQSRIIPVRHRISLARIVTTVPMIAARRIGSSSSRWKSKDNDLYIYDLSREILRAMAEDLPCNPLNRFITNVQVWCTPGREKSEIRINIHHRIPARYIHRLCDAYDTDWQEMPLLKSSLRGLFSALAFVQAEKGEIKYSEKFTAESGSLRRYFFLPVESLSCKKQFDGFSLRVFPDGYDLLFWQKGSALDLKKVGLSSLGVDFDRISKVSLRIAQRILAAQSSEFCSPELIFDREEEMWYVGVDFL